jgi:TolB-like protein
VKLLQELRRRRVFRLAGLYIVGAWVVIEVSSVFFPAWGIPDTALRYLFIAATALFPVALIFGWIFDITPHGIIRTEQLNSAESVDLSLRHSDYAILVALVAIGVVVLYSSFGKIQQEIDDSIQTLERRANSIAVLPFANLDTNPDTGYFSDGVTEEILHRLSTLGVVHVLASTSSFAFRDSDRSPAQIANALGVSYLLRGSVRRDSNQVRVTAQLVDHEGFNIWTDTFDRKLESIFAIQTEIASTVSSEIVNEIVPIQELPAGRTTSNMEAYNAYLVGKSYFDKRTIGWREQAVAAFEQAIELDPGFAPPYAGKAMSIAINAGLGPHVQEAADLARHALELDPGLAEAHAILGLVTAFPTEESDPVQGEQSLRRAIALDPSFSHAYNWLFFALERQGRDEESLEAMDQGLAVDPLNPPLVLNVSGYESGNGNLERALQLLNRLAALPEPPHFVYGALWDTYMEWGRQADAIGAARHLIRGQVTVAPHALDAMLISYEQLGMSAQADQWLALRRDLGAAPLVLSELRLMQLTMRGDMHELGVELDNFTKLQAAEGRQDQDDLQLMRADALFQLGEFADAGNTIENAVGSDFESLVREHNTGEVIAVMRKLAFCWQQTGRNREASELLREIGDYIAIDTVSPSAPPSLAASALHRALLGDKAAALDALTRAVELGFSDYARLANDIAWRETMAEPEFGTLRDKARAERDRQRAIVEAEDAEHDFVAEVKLILARP